MRERLFKPEPLPGRGALAALFFVLLASVPASLFGRPQSEVTVRRRTTTGYFGTFTQIVVFADFSGAGALQNWENCWNETKALLEDLETKLSSEIPEGDIGRFNALNAGSGIAITDETAEVFRLAGEMNELTGGAFNPAVYLLTDLWGFTPRFSLPAQSRLVMPYDRPGGPSSALPEEQYIGAFTRLADFSRCVLGGEEGRFVLSKTGPDEFVDGQRYSLKIDFGAIGKGYAAEKVAELLRAYGYRYGMVNIGSSSFRLLERYVEEDNQEDNSFGADLWPVNIRSPFDRNEKYLTAYGKDEGISTSGSYDRFYTIDGRRYSHIIDGKTGYPSGGEIISATVIGGDAARNDALTTALCVMPAGEARRVMEEYLGDRRVILILSGGGFISNTAMYHRNP
ncbi:MAG: FAD:protein FMN transferase [Spirochaetaceae bacterium]|nr:FAD:protein FMN transferase [Spirochaetaceae bacterium]